MLSTRAEKARSQAAWVFGGAAIAKHSLGRRLIHVCIVRGGEVAVLPAPRGSGALARLQIDGMGLNSIVTK